MRFGQQTTINIEVHCIMLGLRPIICCSESFVHFLGTNGILECFFF